MVHSEPTHACAYPHKRPKDDTPSSLLFVLHRCGCLLAPRGAEHALSIDDANLVYQRADGLCINPGVADDQHPGLVEAAHLIQGRLLQRDRRVCLG
jgi:hypothetical protein